jgi:hypothetical protein
VADLNTNQGGPTVNITNHSGPKDKRSFWQAHIKALADSGLSRREYCRRHHLAYHALTYWVRKQGARTTGVPQLSLVEVALPHRQPLRLGGSAFRLYLQHGRMLEIDADFDQATLHRLLVVLEQRCSL